MNETLLVVQNDPTCPIGLFGPPLANCGLTLEVRRGYAGDPIPDDARGYRGLIVLGGEMAATDDATYPWLTPVKALIRTAVTADCPLLGICLGHQLAAAALGGRVAPNPAGRAIGLTPVTLTAAGRADPLLGGLDPNARAVQWNSDVIWQLPSGADLLAISPDGSPQAARFAPRAWGVQFHPEVSAEIFRSWQDAGASDEEAAAAATAIAAAKDELRDTWQPLAARFAQLCRGGAC